MITSGLVSITFRQLSPAEIVQLVKRASLDGIEWGGDVHVPHGNFKKAREVFKMTEDAGLSVLSYGSYYHAGEPETTPFNAIIDTALELHTNIIRIWAGRQASAEASPDYRKRLIDESRRIAALAAASNIILSYEFHGHTLTDTDQSTVQLLRDVADPHVKSYWQISADRDPEPSLKAMLPWLSNIHVFYWKGGKRLMLSKGARIWLRLLPMIRSTGRDHSAMIEFVKANTPDNFLKDAEALKKFLSV